MERRIHHARDRPAGTGTCWRLDLEIGGVMARRRYTTAEAFRMVASGERKEMRAPKDEPFAETRIIRVGFGVRCEYQSTVGEWRNSALIMNRGDYYDPNESEEPASEPQWRPCSKAFALRHPEESQVRYWTEGHCWSKGVPMTTVSGLDSESVFDFQTFAPPEPGHICEIPEGVTGIEVVTTDGQGRVKSSGTVRTSGKAGRVVFVEDPS